MEEQYSIPEARIFIIDDYDVVRQGLALSLQNFLRNSGDDRLRIEFVGTAPTGKEALEQIPDSGANILFVDIMLPGMTGIDIIRTIREQGIKREQLRILVVTELMSPNIREMFSAGANGYISKQEPSSMFIDAIQAILSDSSLTWLTPETAQKLIKTEYTIKMYGLTPTEVDIIQMLILPNPEIAEKLGVSVGNVRNHLVNIYDKLNLKSRNDLVNFARRLGLVSSPF